MATCLTPSKVLWALLLLIHYSRCYEAEEVVRLRAAAGRDASLPCGQEKVFLDGTGSYVAWMKDEQYIYRYPNDDSDNNCGGGAVCDEAEGAAGAGCEARGRGCGDRTSLRLRAVGAGDAGLYSCRVHYQAMPSVDYVIDVQVIESLPKPRLFADNVETSNGYVGPVALGTDLRLVCEVDDADESTTLYWRRNGRVVSSPTPLRRHPLAVEYFATNVTRDELDARYECAAQNTDVSEPVVAALTVKMYLPPVSVEVRLSDKFDFAAGEPRVVDCVVVGCVPPPTVTWHLAGAMLQPNTHKEHHEGNFTVSSLSVAPTLREQNATLACRAHNHYLPDQVYQHAVTINVGYKPVCLRSREETLGLVAGATETVTCSVEAAPEPVQFIWTFESSRRAYTPGKRIPGHQHRYSSTLNFRATPEDIGTLECRASNAFGVQERPCAYALRRGGVPDAPACLLLHAPAGVARVECKKGFDGGRPQMIHLQIVNEEGAVLSNHSNSLGHFHLQPLKDQRNLTAHIFASSSRGRSAVATLQLHNFTPVSATVGGGDDGGGGGLMTASVYRLLLVMLETSAVVALVGGTMAAVRARRMRRQKRPAADERQGPDVVPLSRSDGSFHREPDFLRGESIISAGTAQHASFKVCPLPKAEAAGGSVCFAQAVCDPAQTQPPPLPQVAGPLQTGRTAGFFQQNSFYV